MTKDGRPSRISDIRYFCGGLWTYLDGHEEAVAFGRRIAWCLNGEGFSLDAYPALYLFFTPSIPSGSVQVTDFGGEWWHRFTHVGVPADFPNRADVTDLVIAGTVSALSAIRPDKADLIRNVAQLVRQHGADLRFPIKRKETK